MREGDLGFSDKGVMALEINALNYQQNEDAFLRVKNDLKKIASIENVSFSSCLPGEQLIHTSIRLSSAPAENTQNCDVQVITSDYFKVYGMEMIEGRLFSEDDPGDLLTVVVNESLARELSKGDHENIINKEVTVDWARNAVKFKVIGIVKDYHHSSKKQKIQPMLFIQLKNTFAVFRISVKSSDMANWKSTELLVQKALKENLTDAYSKRGIQVAFDVVDVETAYNKQYSSDEQFSKFLNALTFLAISMAGIGFFSLASTTTRKRTREIAIRKVYGARVVDMSVLLSSYFLKLAGAALAISLPLSYFFTQNWLKQFSSRIEMGVWFALWPVIIVISLTLLSISFFVLKLVFVSPIHHLRND
jgi:putative ABC transport system permease protein